MLLLLLGAIELATAAFGLGSLALFDAGRRLALGWPLPAIAAINLAARHRADAADGRDAADPGFASGRDAPAEIGSAVGTLYYVNTLGAGAACLVCVALHLSVPGHAGARSMIAAAINLAVGVGAFGSRRMACQRDAAETTPSVRAGRRSRRCSDCRSSLLLAAAGRLRRAVLRDLPVPHRFLCDRIELDRLRADAQRLPGRHCRRLAQGRRRSATGLRRTRRCGKAAERSDRRPICSALLFLPLLAHLRLARPRHRRRRHAAWSIWSRASGARCCLILSQFGIAADNRAGMQHRAALFRQHRRLRPPARSSPASC